MTRRQTTSCFVLGLGGQLRQRGCRYCGSWAETMAVRSCLVLGLGLVRENRHLQVVKAVSCVGLAWHFPGESSLRDGVVGEEAGGGGDDGHCAVHCA